MENIVVKGARQHNLKNISVSIPKNKLVVFTGISGSGKSSLAFDTIYAEGQRRYVESLSSYARQFLGVMDKPDVDSIEGLSPAISIDQKSVSHNPRSTVGTITEIYDYLRLLFARVGHPHCQKCGHEISHLTIPQIVGKVFEITQNSTENWRKSTEHHKRLLILAPIVKDRKGEYKELFKNLKQKGYQRVRIDGKIYGLNEDFVLIKTNKHTIEAVIDRLNVSQKDLKQAYSVYETTPSRRHFPTSPRLRWAGVPPGRWSGETPTELRKRLVDSIETALKLADGEVIVTIVRDKSFEFPQKPEKMEDYLFSEKFACPVCGISISEIEPRTFSFNSPHGACPTCSGLGTLLKIDQEFVLRPILSISEGGIMPFSNIIEGSTWFSRVFLAMAGKENIDLRTAIKNLSQEKINKILYGTGDYEYEVYGENRYGRMVKIFEVFGGIIRELERRYRESESEYVRQEIERYMRHEVCPDCLGKRLKREALSITVNKKTIADISAFPINQLSKWISELNNLISDKEKEISRLILKEIKTRLQFLLDVGLSYLTLGRSATTLSAGETQRIRLASQIGSGLSGVLYVLDEPSIGLHQRDNKRLIDSLKKLRDLQNTVIVVEHDREMMESADFIFDFGPGAGENGGKIVAYGTPEEIKKNKKSLTGEYLSGKKKIEFSGNWDFGDERRLPTSPDLVGIRGARKSAKTGNFLTLTGCSEHNLKNIDVSFPLGKFICVAGVSGSGKSTLIDETLYQALALQFNPYHKEKPGKFRKIEGLENLDKVILIDQSPIGRTPRSNPATYTGSFFYIRELFAKTHEAKVRGFKPGRFSFNVKGGRCEECEGQGVIKIEMQFMSDVYVTCDACKGKRYNAEALEITYKQKNIAEILNMSVSEALNFFSYIFPLSNKLKTLQDVGLGYIKIGQPAPTLSGGEAQRVKLASELSKKMTGKTLYLLDEPTTGLHFADLEKLLRVLHRLVDRGNTVIIIEHNLDVIKNADYIIDLGPEGGENGGEVVACGTPQEVALNKQSLLLRNKQSLLLRNKQSYTGQFLRDILK